MNIRKSITAAFILGSLPLSSSVSARFSWSYKMANGKAVTEIPARAAGQESALDMTAPKLKVVRVVFVGLGTRGHDAVECWTHIPGIRIMTLCDYERDRAERYQEYLCKASMPAVDIYSGEDGYKGPYKCKDIDLVYIVPDWKHHLLVAYEAMNNGEHVAVEVPAATNLTGIWKLIDISERKHLHYMVLENYHYDFSGLNSLNMTQKDAFGEILYVRGAYHRELLKFRDAYQKKDAQDKLGWRLDYNQKFHDDVYAIYGLNPIAQILNIHEGDKMNTLVTVDAESVNGKKQAEKMIGEPCKEFRNDDQTTTLISTKNGKAIEIHHNVMTPQSHNCMYQLAGTRGSANKCPLEGFALSAEKMKKSGVTPSPDNLSGHSYLPQVDIKILIEKYESPIVTEYEKQVKEAGGYGSMDLITGSRLVCCLQNGLPLNIDVYDLAERYYLAELGFISMDNGNIPAKVPGFTRGEWNKVKGLRHVCVSSADEAQTATDATDFTAKLKEKDKKYWEKIDKATKKK